MQILVNNQNSQHFTAENTAPQQLGSFVSKMPGLINWVCNSYKRITLLMSGYLMFNGKSLRQFDGYALYPLHSPLSNENDVIIIMPRLVICSLYSLCALL